MTNNKRRSIISEGLKGVFTLGLVILCLCFQGCKEDEKDQPLYWVAPMDPNFRKDGPGKSPMGMDLVPVFEESSQALGPGVVEVSAELESHLGVRSVKVERGRLELSLRTYGRVAFDQSLVQKLSPRVTGWVDMLFVVTEGEPVRQGQPLYALYSPQLIEAQKKYLRALESGQPQTISYAEDELRVLNIDQRSISKLKQERIPQKSVIFHAPKDGVVGMLKVSEDDFVEPGDLIMSLGTLDTVWIEMNIFASQASLIKPRQLLTLTTPSYPGLTWKSEINYIYPALTGRKRSLLFRGEIENLEMKLKPNMLVRGQILLSEREPALLVPRQSVIDLGERSRIVLSLGEGRYKSVNVTLGETNNEHIEVLEGLEEGDEVVLSAQFLIDSESSKTSDFQRLAGVSEKTQKYPSTWVAATIREIDLPARKLRLQHEYIDDWKMPAMTMYFQAVDELDLRKLEVGDQVRVKVSDGDPLFTLQDLEFNHADSKP